MNPNQDTNLQNETTPLLSSDKFTNPDGELAVHAVSASTTSPFRPKLLRSASTSMKATTAPSLHSPKSTALPASAAHLSRPVLGRAATSSTAAKLKPLSESTATRAKATTPARPSLLNRITSTLSLAPDALVPVPEERDDTPTVPSHWTDHAHRAALLQIYDTEREAATMGPGKSRSTLEQQVTLTRRKTIEQFPELETGDVPLTVEWVEQVLTASRRSPFNTPGGMGRWEMLSMAASGRGGWGPW